MTPNGQGFLLCWYSVIRQPEPKLSKVNAVDIIFCSWALPAGRQVRSARTTDDKRTGR